MKIGWDSKYTPYTWGIRCDVCDSENDPEAHNMSGYSIAANWGDWQVCSKKCMKEFDPDLHPPRWPDEEYKGGIR